MIDRDAEIAAMVDKFLVETAPTSRGTPMGKARSAAQRAWDHRFYREKTGMATREIPNMLEDCMIVSDETPLADVVHAGVIGTETE